MPNKYLGFNLLTLLFLLLSSVSAETPLAKISIAEHLLKSGDLILLPTKDQNKYFPDIRIISFGQTNPQDSLQIAGESKESEDQGFFIEVEYESGIVKSNPRLVCSDSRDSKLERVKLFSNQSAPPCLYLNVCDQGQSFCFEKWIVRQETLVIKEIVKH
ncbi:MAG: hypothetical protein WD512_16665 [Candidatus Paceibacterota bacterium]